MLYIEKKLVSTSISKNADLFLFHVRHIKKPIYGHVYMLLHEYRIILDVGYHYQWFIFF